MRIKLSNWPFKEDEIVTLHWIASPKIDSEGEKICEVYFRTENGAIKSVPIAWGSLPELRIGQKFTNKKLINDLIHNKEVSISTNRVYKLKYGKAVDIIPRDLYTLKVYSIFGEWCCSFEHNWYTYYVPCVELARIFLARNTTLANQLLSTGGLEDLIDISSWQIDGSEVKFEFRNETPGITDTFAKTFAAIYGTPELHRIWESTYTQYVATGMIQTELPAGTYIKLFFTENEGTKQRFVNSIEFNDITSIFQKVTYGPAKLVHSRKSAEKKGVINTHLPSDDSEIDATGALARRTHFTTETTSSGGSFLDHIEAERLKITDNSALKTIVIEQADAEESFSVGDVSTAGKKASISMEMRDIQLNNDPDFASFCKAIEMLGQYTAISITDVSFADLPQGKRFSFLSLSPKRPRKYICVSLQKGPDAWVILELCNKDGYSISTLFTRCSGNKEELVNRIIDKLMIRNGSWSRKHFPKLHSAPLNGRWCGDQRPPCGLSGRLIMCEFLALSPQYSGAWRAS